METTFTSWLTLAGLGAFHGLNPGMGWLFAVALGMQENRRTAVWRALIPLTLGHLLAIAAAIGVAMVAGTALSPAMLRWPVALLLVGLGVRQLYRHAAPAMGGHAGGNGRPDALVILDGVGAWRGTDGSAGVSVDDGGGRRSFLPCTGGFHTGFCRCDGDAGAWAGVPGRDGADRVVCGRSPRAGTPAEGLDQSGCDLGGGTDSHRLPDSDGLVRPGS